LEKVYLQVQRQDIAYITKIFEAMSHLAVVSTVDRSAGILRVMYSKDAEKDIKAVLETLPCTVIEYHD